MSLVDRVLGRGDAKTSVVTRRGTQIDLRVVAATSSARRCSTSPARRGTTSSCGSARSPAGWTLNEYALSEIEGGQRRRQRDRGADLRRRSASPSSRRSCARTPARSRRPRRARSRAPMRRGHRRLSRAHRRVSGDGRSLARRGGRGGEGARLPACSPSPITPRGRCRASAGRRSSSSGEAIRALQRELGDSLRLLHGVELNIGPEGELDYDLEFRARLRLVPRLGPRPLRARSRRADQAGRDRDARPGGAHDRPPLRAHDRRPPAHRARPRRRRRGGRGDRHRARGERRRSRASTCRSRRSAARAVAHVTFVLTSDAHHAEELERVRYAALNAERAWVDPARVANARGAESLLAWLA